jgi:hypothetical protein
MRREDVEYIIIDVRHPELRSYRISGGKVTEVSGSGGTDV